MEPNSKHADREIPESQYTCYDSFRIEPLHTVSSGSYTARMKALVLLRDNFACRLQ